MINREIEAQIKKVLHKGKAILLYGPRQVGKTTLLEKLFHKDKNTLWLNGDDMDTQSVLNNTSTSKLKNLLKTKKYLIIDEAQRIPEIGLVIKIITDSIKTVQVVATGSSAFELASKTKESLTGRKYEFYLYPFSFNELKNNSNFIIEKSLLHSRLLYGSYPEVINNPGKEREILNQLTDSFLYKDLFAIEEIKKTDKLVKLLQALALQVGSEVSYNELSKLVGLNHQTVEKYINYLEQAFVIFRLSSLSRNLRKELSQSRKIYFYDCGIRNALIAQFSNISLRPDVGALWENYIIAERLKHLKYNKMYANTYFWRTQDQQEIDYIEDKDGILHTYEIKWNKNKKSYLTKTFSKAYPNHTYDIINSENYDDYL